MLLIVVVWLPPRLAKYLEPSQYDALQLFHSIPVLGLVETATASGEWKDA